MIKRRDYFKYVFSSALGLFASVVKPSIIAQAASKKSQKRSQAQLLTQIGEKYLNEGRASEALESPGNQLQKFIVNLLTKRVSLAA
jgi:hypothetical protein